MPECFLIEIISNSPQDTFSLGQRIASFLTAGTVVALQGELGSGKTYLVKGIAKGLGITETITSPTYTIISEYWSSSEDRSSSGDQSSVTLYHIDAYRLDNDEDFENLGGSEIINSGGISLIEWSERIPKSLPKERITIIFRITGPSSRLIQISGLDSL
ncbi:MAG: tRNA (adenosine(37)-N6)-threonylcarbamoyltransferase complex ATPase subunit type 1 TsaE [Treponema sp.]|jgi:tRNA threonylcarbamoyladenosine biosynthesis protein TsaE|nr:tRNA (adenosine(37)-N6)-threonylcarbamoyltransferase complex ATPase subunit type 1 TsaE [Treponema sp.]